MAVETLTPPVEAVAAPPATPAAVEPQTQAPAEAVVQANPSVTKATLDKESEARKAEKRLKVEAYKAKLREDNAGTPTKAKPAAQSEATHDATAEAEMSASQQNPDSKPVSKDSKPDTKSNAKTKEVKVKAKDIAGKEIDLTVDMDQAVKALLRDRWTIDDVRHLPDHRVLALGSEKFLAQRENDQAYTRNFEAQRRGETGTQTPPGAPVQAAKSGEPSAQPAAAAQPTGTPPAQAPAMDPTSDARFKALEEQFGTEGAKSILAVFQQQGTPDQVATLRQAIEQRDAQHQALANQMIELRFENEFEKMARNYPQLDAEGGEPIKQSIRSYTESILKSGVHPTATVQEFNASFKIAVSQAADAVLGKQKTETHARQLAQRQKQQVAGQIVAGSSREESPSPSLTLQEAKRKAFEEFRRTGSIEAGKKAMQRFASTSG